MEQTRVGHAMALPLRDFRLVKAGVKSVKVVAKVLMEQTLVGHTMALTVCGYRHLVRLVQQEKKAGEKKEKSRKKQEKKGVRLPASCQTSAAGKKS